MGEDVRSDTELVTMAIDGDLQAFGVIVRRYQGAVYAAALRRMGTAADAEDVVQEVFLAAFESLGKLREPEKLPAWLLSIVRNTCGNWIRRPWEPELIAARGDLHDAALHNALPRPDEGVQQKELQEQILAAVSSLPRPTAEVVSLYYMDG